MLSMTCVVCGITTCMACGITTCVACGITTCVACGITTSVARGITTCVARGITTSVARGITTCVAHGITTCMMCMCLVLEASFDNVKLLFVYSVEFLYGGHLGTSKWFAITEVSTIQRLSYYVFNNLYIWTQKAVCFREVSVVRGVCYKRFFCIPM